MKKLLTLAAILAVAVFLSGCQNSVDSKSSSSEQDDENSIVMKNGENASGRDSEGNKDDGCGDGMDSGCGDGCGDGCSDDGCGGGCGDGCSDGGCSDDGCSDDGCSDGGCSDDGCSDGGSSDDGCSDGGSSDDGCSDDGCSDGGCSDGGGEGNGGVPQYKAGTAENAVIQTWKAIKDGKLTGLSEFISLRAKGDLAAIRDGKLTAEKLSDLKQQMTKVKFLRPRTRGSSKTISLQNEKGWVFRFTCRKEDGKYVIRELLIKEPSKSKRRKRY